MSFLVFANDASMSFLEQKSLVSVPVVYLQDKLELNWLEQRACVFLVMDIAKMLA